MKKIVATVLILISYSARAQYCNCDSTFMQVKTITENNYAGWFDKMKSINTVAYKTITDNTTAAVKSIKTDSLCYSVIKKWVQQFNDGHLYLRYIQPEKTGTQQTAAIQIKQVNLSEEEAKKYFDIRKTKINLVEGIWENENYKVAIMPEKGNAAKWNAVVLRSENKNWNNGEVKFTIQKKGNSYSISYINGDKDYISVKPAKIVKDILDGTENFFYKVHPAPIVKSDFEAYVYDADPTNPRLSFTDATTAVFTLPNFYPQNYSLLNNLLNKNKTKLATVTNWIIDLRNNEGGNVAVSKLLLPYLYTNAIIDYNTRARITKTNYTKWFNRYVKESYDAATEADRKEYDSIRNIVLQHEGEFWPITNNVNVADTIRFDKIIPAPKKVAIIIDENTTSSAELFCALAKQSSKVTFYGQPSDGTIDYGNIISYETNCPTIRLTLPTDRYNWLDYGISVDRDKIKPDVYIPANNKNWLLFVQTDLKKRN